MKISWSAVRKVLGRLTDLLNEGRKRGWWLRRPGPPTA
jgi:hypothetical protein